MIWGFSEQIVKIFKRFGRGVRVIYRRFGMIDVFAAHDHLTFIGYNTVINKMIIIFVCHCWQHRQIKYSTGLTAHDYYFFTMLIRFELGDQIK